MESEQSEDVSEGSLSIRPTAAALWMLAGAFGAIVLSGERSISLAPAIVLVLLIALDAVLSVRQLRSQSFVACVHTHTVESPERVQVTLQTPPTSDHVLVTPSFLSPFDYNTEDGARLLRCGGETVDLEYPDGHPRNVNFLRWNASTTTLGLVGVARVDACSTAPIHRGPEPRQGKVDFEGIEETARLREYVTGDLQSRVSWAATARTGRLHVRVPETVEDAEVCMVVYLGKWEDVEANPLEHLDGVELALSIAAGVGRSVLEAGGTLRLITNEVGEGFYEAEAAAFLSQPHRTLLDVNALDFGIVHVDMTVDNTQELTRRLSRAETSPIERPDCPHLFVDHSGARWSRQC